ncbi:cyclase family protein [Agrococcus sp. Marseille-Q4369]|uniref:cyclase family protein n=1 Tax=Agrococcus sp. Marseille-Q4369 TaxID=2810513 RepID=UPI001B8BAA1A|nr:cyclase family protein [Agrococcus sp. Marseille-Q4369]QUW19061.1 cyclase family protein [Agrococcus sp. Marseille-Q4369]
MRAETAGERRGTIVDLSHPVVDGMQVYPGDPEVRIAPALTVAADGVDVASIRMGSHAGTHVDAPSHSIEGGRTMADVALDELVGEALVVRVPGLSGGDAYGWRELEASGSLPERLPPIVLIDTGWAARFDTELALQHPALAADAARELQRRGMRVLAVDTLSPDPTGAADASFPVHEVVLGADGLIIENVRGLESLPAPVRVGFFPLRLAGDGAPVRAVAFLD